MPIGRRPMAESSPSARGGSPSPVPGGVVPPHPGPMREPAPEFRASGGPAPAATRRREAGRRWPKDRLVVAAELVLLVLFLEFIQGTLQLVNPAFLPPPSRWAEALVRLATQRDLLGHIVFSVSNFLTGYSLAAITGVILGLAIGGSRPLLMLVAPIVWALYAMPLIAIRPMTTIWFGFGSAPIIFLVFLSALLPVILNTMAGVRTVDPSLIRAASVFGANGIQTYVKVVLPATVPFILVGLRLAVVTGWIILLASELVGAPRGFGSILAVATSRFRVDEAFAVIFMIVVVSITSVRLVGLLERRVSSWRATVTS